MIGYKGEYEGMREQYERVLGNVKDLTRYLRNRTKDMERIKTREIDTSSDMEEKILDLLEVQSKINIRELEIGKVRLE